MHGARYFLLTPAGSDTPLKPREDSWYASRSECRALSEPSPGGSVLESRSISYLYFPQRRSPHIGTVTFVILLLKWLRSSQSHWKRPSWKKPTHFHELYQCKLVVLQHLHYALAHTVMQDLFCHGKEHSVPRCKLSRPPKSVNKQSEHCLCVIPQLFALSRYVLLIMFSLEVNFLSFIILCLKGACLWYCGGEGALSPGRFIGSFIHLSLLL